MKKCLTLSLLFISGGIFGQDANTWEYYEAAPRIVSLAAQNNTILAGSLGGGLVRFDTLFNRTFYNSGNTNLPSDSILQAEIDLKGDWWVKHSKGISKFDGFSWQTWTIDQTGLPSNASIQTLRRAPDSSLYVISFSGVAIFKNNTWTTLTATNSGLPTNSLFDVAFHPNGKVYYASFGKGLIEQDGSNWTSYTSANTGITLINNVMAVAITDAGVIWLTGGSETYTPSRLAKFDQGAWQGFNVTQIGLPSTSLYFYDLVASGNDLWLTTGRNLSKLSNGVWIHNNVVDGVECGYLSNVAPAPVVSGANQVWLPLCDVAVFDEQGIKIPGTGLPGPPRGVLFNGLAEDTQGNIWVGTAVGKAITKFDGTKWEQYYPTMLGASKPDVFSVQADPNGAVWFGLEQAEILKYENGNWTLIDTCKTVFPNRVMLSSATAPNGDQWFTFSAPQFSAVCGIAVYTSEGDWLFYTSADIPALQNAYMKKVVFDHNGVGWFATGYNGVLKYDSGLWKVINSSNSNLPDNTVYDVDIAPDGALWASTFKGVARYNGQNWTNYNVANSGLLSNLIYAMAFDKAGGMYVGYDYPDMNTVGPTSMVLRQGVWTPLLPPGWEGMVNQQPDAFIVDSKNRLWFANFTGDGVYRYDPMLVNTENPASSLLKLSVSPNPCSAGCQLIFEAPVNDKLHLKIHNNAGQLLKHYAVTVSDDQTIPLDIHMLSAGLYRVGVWKEHTLLGAVSVVKE